MERIERVLNNYWIGYYIVFAACAGVYLYRHNWGLSQWDNVGLLSDIFGASAGIALLVVISVEVLGRMVLLIPKTVRAILEKGRAEGEAKGEARGRAEGRAEGEAAGKALGREAQSRRVNEAYARFGIEVDGVRVLPDTPEVNEFLQGTSQENSTDSE